VPVDLADALAGAATLQEQWRFAAAREALTTLLAGSVDSADRLAVVTGRRMFAEVLRDLGELDEAHAIAEPLVTECERRFGPDHPATARAMTVLATVVHALGDLDGAEERYGQVLDGRFAEAGEAGRAVLLAEAYLALLYRDRGDLDRARITLDAAHKGMRRAYGITDPDTIQFGVELARMAARAGDMPAARRLYAVARAGCQARLEPWHPLYLAAERELAAVEPAPAPRRADLLPGDADLLPGDADPHPGRAPSGEPGARKVPLWPAGALAGHLPAQQGSIPAQEGSFPAAASPASPRPRRRRRTLVIAVAVAIVAALVTALMVTAGWPGRGRHTAGPGSRPTTGTAGHGAVAPGNSGASSPAPSTPAPSHPPLRVELRDDGTKLVATWGVLLDGPAPIVVAVARDGRPATVVADLPAGATRYTVTNVDPRAEYCVIVAAVYPGETASGATSVCTRRTKATPGAPKPSPKPSR
jgi:Tetratricopeptide repeat